MTNQNYKIRYSRHDPCALGSCKEHVKQPKDTLITIQDGPVIYFGIARCKRSVDNFRKSEGRKLALDRALFAKTGLSWPTMSTFYLDETGLLGYCQISYVKLLLKYFESLGEYKKWTKK